jgi:drug/metabolite transporter (DMT)-like permease
MKTNGKSGRTGALFCVAAAAALWGSLGTFYHFLSGYGFSRGDVILLRTGVAALGLFLFLLFTDRTKLKIRLRDIWMFFGTGIVSFFLLSFFYLSAMEYTSVSVAAVLLYTAPAFVVLMSALFFGERLTKRKVAALFMTLPGCAIVSGLFGASGGYPAAGILFGLGSGMAYALYTVFSRLALRRYDSMTISFYTFLFATVSSLFLASPPRIAAALVSPGAWALAIGLGVCTALLPYLLYTKGLTGTGNGEASITATLEPVVAMLLSILILREQMTWEKLIGISLILGAVLLIAFGERMRERQEKKNGQISQAQ